MITAVCFALAAIALCGRWLLEQARQWAESSTMPAIDGRHIAAGILLAAGAMSWAARPADKIPDPRPEPVGFSLAGCFVGPDASADAATTGALCRELSDELEWDAGQPADSQLLKTGQSFDQLRQRARLLLCRGVSLGEKHPRAKAAIEEYLNGAAGTSGGPLTPAQRTAWVAAYRVVARAAEDAAR